MTKNSLIIFFLLLLPAAMYADDSQVRITRFDERDGFTESYVTGVIQDSEGFVWVSSWNGLSRYDGYKFVTFKGHPGDGCPLEINRINGIAELRNHDIVCKSDKRYYVFKRSTKSFEKIDGKRYSRLIRLFHLAPDVKARIMSLPEYRNIEVKFLCQDRQGGVWIQSNRGLERVWFVRKPILTEKYGTEGEESVRGLFCDSRGRVWIADKNGVVRVIPRMERGKPLLGQTTLFLSPSGKLSSAPVSFGSNVYSFCEDTNGDLWLGSKPGGLFRLRPAGDGFAVSHFAHDASDKWSLSDNSVYDIVRNPAGGLFIATFNGGLNIMRQERDGAVRFVNANNMLRRFPREAMQCRSMLMASDGTLLVGTVGGLVTCRPENDARRMRFHLNRRNPSASWTLSSNYIMGMLRMRDGTVLVATSGGGIDRILSHDLLTDTIHFDHFSHDEGLSSDMVLALQEDPSGRVWVVSEASLSRIDLRRRESVNFMRGFFSGLFAFTEIQPVCLPDGLIVIGTTQGTLSFNTLDISKSSFTPNIVFSCGGKLDIDAGKKDFSVTFAALDYNKNEDIVYAYKLEGIDNEWHYTTANELHYVGLQPGDYRLRVKSTNGDGVWTNNEKVVDIHRKAALTETPYFWMVLGLLATVVMLTIYKVVVYIRKLQDEIKDIRLTSNEKIAILGDRVRELLSISEPVEKAETETGNPQLTKADREFAEKVEAFVSENIANPDLAVKDMAEALFVSRTVLYARIKKIFNCSPNNLVLNMRIDKAKQLLDEGDALVAEVAYGCGFSDPKYFSRCFKKLTGKNPTEWKR